MPALTWKEKEKQKTLYEMGYQYLVENFHKFKQESKIRVALDVISIFNKDGSKSAPQNILIIRHDADKTEEISGRVLVHPSALSGDGVSMGNGKIDVRNIKNIEALPGVPEQSGADLSP